MNVWAKAASAAAVLGLLAAGCSKRDGTGPTEPARSDVVVGVSLLTRTHPFYQYLEAGLRAAATTEEGYELLIAAGEFDVARQKDQLADFVAKKVNAVVVCPCDSKSIGTSIAKANQAGVPVFTADIAASRRARRSSPTSPLTT